ncbi:hypothetical protein [Streptomyces sp. NPDC051561]|uniref:hypothetical protein n=1 Tax=Streptomyces sp. NPDC051561 TaxID=3365658 RepID=UPI0037B124B2
MTDPNDAYHRLISLLIGPLEVDFALISPEATLADMQLDSLAAEEFVLLAAEEFGGAGAAPDDLARVPLAELAARLSGAELTAAGHSGAAHSAAGHSGGDPSAAGSVSG